MKVFWMVWAATCFALTISFALTGGNWEAYGMCCLFAICQIDICTLKEEVHRLEESK